MNLWQEKRWNIWIHLDIILPLDPKTMKNEGFKPLIYELYTLKMKVLGSHGSYLVSSWDVAIHAPFQDIGPGSLPPSVPQEGPEVEAGVHPTWNS